MMWIIGIGIVIAIGGTLFVVSEQDSKIKKYEKEIDNINLKKFSIDDAVKAYVESAEAKYQQYILDINRKIKYHSEEVAYGFTISYKNPYCRVLKRIQKYYADLGYTVELSDDCKEFKISYLNKIEEKESE